MLRYAEHNAPMPLNEVCNQATVGGGACACRIGDNYLNGTIPADWVLPMKLTKLYLANCKLVRSWVPKDLGCEGWEYACRLQ